MDFSDKLYHADIDVTASGVTEIIAAPTSGVIVIDHINWVQDAASNIALKHATTAFNGLYRFVANQGLALDNVIGSRDGLLKCGAGEAFNIDSSATANIGGFVKYRIIDAN